MFYIMLINNMNIGTGARACTNTHDLYNIQNMNTNIDTSYEHYKYICIYMNVDICTNDNQYINDNTN